MSLMESTGTVPFFDLKAVNAPIASELALAAQRVIASGWYILGAELQAFEQAFAQYVGAKHAIGVANGLDALALTLRAWKAQGRLRAGDGVVVPANTYIASVLAITENGLRPVLVEPNPATYNLDVRGVELGLAQGARAVLGVHLYGQLAPMAQIAALCRDRGVPLLEDCAQAHGAHSGGRMAGSFGEAAGFSFYPAKNLGALGDGGAITTSDDDLAALLTTLRNYGSERKYHNARQGPNSRLDDMQAAMLGVKLPLLDEANARRRNVAERYCREIVNPHIVLPAVAHEPGSHVWHLFVVRCCWRDRLAAHLAARGVQTAIHYPVPPHRQRCYTAELGHHALLLTEVLHREVLSLPMSPTLSETQIAHVIDAVNAFA